MTGTDVLRQALMLLNYTDVNGDINAANNANVTKRALPIINQVYADLWEPHTGGENFSPLTGLRQEIPLSDYTLYNIMPYGVAMFLAQSEGDTDNQAMYAELYNQRRPGAFISQHNVADVLPRTYL